MRFLRRLWRKVADSLKQFVVPTSCLAYQPDATAAMTDDTLLPFDLPAVRRKKLTVDFDGGNQSSDAGLLLLRQGGRRGGGLRGGRAGAASPPMPVCCCCGRRSAGWAFAGGSPMRCLIAVIRTVFGTRCLRW